MSLSETNLEEENEQVNYSLLLNDLLTYCPKISKSFQSEHFLFDEHTIETICILALNLFRKDDSFVELHSQDRYDTVNVSRHIVIGDIHGQYYDLVRILHSQKINKQTRYIFLGDLVDRGPNSIECTLLVFLMKIINPTRTFLIRGNHECPEINHEYGFERECNDCFSNNPKIWAMFNSVFQYLPLCLSVEQRIFCVHGGISPSLDSLDMLRNINRQDLLTIPEEGLVTDLTWADPDITAATKSSNGFAESDRGCSYIFSESIAKKFCEKFGYDFVCRAHQCVQNGYEFFSGKHLLTIFSASNYCGDTGNFGAILQINSSLECNIVVYEPLDSTDIYINQTKYPFVTKTANDFFGLQSSNSSSLINHSLITTTHNPHTVNNSQKLKNNYENNVNTGIIPIHNIPQFVKNHSNSISRNYNQNRDKSPPPGLRTRSRSAKVSNVQPIATSSSLYDDNNSLLLQKQRQLQTQRSDLIKMEQNKQDEQNKQNKQNKQDKQDKQDKQLNNANVPTLSASISSFPPPPRSTIYPSNLASLKKTREVHMLPIPLPIKQSIKNGKKKTNLMFTGNNPFRIKKQMNEENQGNQGL